MLKGLCCLNVNIENQQETCSQIGTHLELTISFLDLSYTKDSISRGYIRRQNI